MTADHKFEYFGSIPLLSGSPSFATPVFKRTGSNEFWVQDVSEHDRIVEFRKIDPDLNEYIVQSTGAGLYLAIGNSALTVFLDGERERLCGSADELIGLLSELMAAGGHTKHLLRNMIGLLQKLTQTSKPTVIPVDDRSAYYFQNWRNSAFRRWESLTAKLVEKDWRKMEMGYWSVSFEIQPFPVVQLGDVRFFLDNLAPKFSGWPPFTYLHGDKEPYPLDDVIEVWMGGYESSSFADFWRVSKTGKGFLLRGMQEDDTDYKERVGTVLPGTSFDWVFPIWRQFEVLQFIKSFARHFGADDSQFELFLQYENTHGRELNPLQHKGFYLDGSGPAKTTSISSQLSGTIAEIETSPVEFLYALLSPVYEQFQFARLEVGLVERIVHDAKEYNERS